MPNVNWDDFTPIDQPAIPDSKAVDWSQFEVAPEETGYIAGLARSAYRGIAGLGETVGRQIEYNPEYLASGKDTPESRDQKLLSPIDRLGRNIKEASTRAKELVAPAVAGDSETKRSIFQGVESAPTSIAYLAPSIGGGIAGTVLDPFVGPAGNIGGAVAGQAASAALMYRDQAQQESEQLDELQKEGKLKAGITNADKLKVAQESGHHEWVGESISDIPEAILFSRFPILRTASQTAKGVLKPGVKEFAKTYVKVWPVEQMGEGYSAGMEKRAENKALNADNQQSAWEAIKQQAGPTTVLSLMLTGGGHGLQRIRGGKLVDALENTKTSEEDRLKIATDIAERLKESNGDAAAKNFMDHAANAILNPVTPKTLDLSDPALLLPYGESKPISWKTPKQNNATPPGNPPITPDAVIDQVTGQDTGLNREGGTLERVAVAAVDAGTSAQAQTAVDPQQVANEQRAAEKANLASAEVAHKQNVLLSKIADHAAEQENKAIERQSSAVDAAHEHIQAMDEGANPNAVKAAKIARDLGISTGKTPEETLSNIRAAIASSPERTQKKAEFEAQQAKIDADREKSQKLYEDDQARKNAAITAKQQAPVIEAARLAALQKASSKKGNRVTDKGIVNPDGAIVQKFKEGERDALANQQEQVNGKETTQAQQGKAQQPEVSTVGAAEPKTPAKQTGVSGDLKATLEQHYSTLSRAATSVENTSSPVMAKNAYSDLVKNAAETAKTGKGKAGYFKMNAAKFKKAHPDIHAALMGIHDALVDEKQELKAAPVGKTPEQKVRRKEMVDKFVAMGDKAARFKTDEELEAMNAQHESDNAAPEEITLTEAEQTAYENALNEANSLLDESFVNDALDRFSKEHKGDDVAMMRALTQYFEGENNAAKSKVAATPASTEQAKGSEETGTTLGAEGNATQQATQKVRRLGEPTLKGALLGMGGVKRSTANDVIGDKPSGLYKSVFTDNGQSIESLIGKSALDSFLPPELRFETRDNPNSPPPDMNEAAQYIKDLIASGERVIGHEEQVEKYVAAHQKEEDVTHKEDIRQREKALKLNPFGKTLSERERLLYAAEDAQKAQLEKIDEYMFEAYGELVNHLNVEHGEDAVAKMIEETGSNSPAESYGKLINKARELTRVKNEQAISAKTSGNVEQANAGEAPPSGNAGSEAVRNRHNEEGLQLTSQTEAELKAKETRAADESIAAKEAADRAAQVPFTLAGQTQPKPVGVQGDILSKQAKQSAKPITAAEVDAIKDIPTTEKMREAIDAVGEKKFQDAVIAKFNKYKPSSEDQKAMLVEAAAIEIIAENRRPSEAKQPWQMSPLEYAQSKVPGALTADSYKAQHRIEVKAALDRGETVPKEVLDEYPALEGKAPESKQGAVQDFGSDIGGARKDLESALHKQWSDDDLAREPLSKIWPASEIEKIDDPFVAAVAFAARQEIPSKPRTSYKVDLWVGKVKALRNFTSQIVDGTVAKDAFVERLKGWKTLDGFAAKVSLLESIDRDQWKRIGSVGERPDAYHYDADGKKVSEPLVMVQIDGRTQYIKGMENIADAMPRINELLGVEAQAKGMQFEVRKRGNEYFIVKKGDSEYRKLKTFDNQKEAIDYRHNNHKDLLAAWEAVKERDNVKEADVRNKENRPRTAEDWRKGKDITSEQFGDTFGFRGGKFGNWVNQGSNVKERQGMINHAYDAMMDLSHILNIPPKAISLNGDLGMLFGAAGHGWASAHYDPTNLVINLTKTRGAGTFAHEWFHAMDNYFQRNRGAAINREQNYITYSPENYYERGNQRMPARDFEAATTGIADIRGTPEQKKNAQNHRIIRDATQWHKVEGVRPEVGEKFAELVKALNESPMAKRASLIDKGKAEGYWSRIIERAARSFENYVIAKMAENGYHNDYLANVIKPEEFVRDVGRYPYLKDEELAPVKEAFDNLFGTLKTKETEKGTTLFSLSDLPEKDQIAVKRSALLDGIFNKVRDGKVNYDDYEYLRDASLSSIEKFADRNGVVPMFSKGAKQFEVAEKSAFDAANKELKRQSEYDVEEEMRSIAEGGNGADLSKLTKNPTYWNAEDEEFTEAGLKEVDRLNREIAEERAGHKSATEFSDLNDAHQIPQAEAFTAYAKALGFNAKHSHSTGGSSYVEISIGDESFKVRFADHFNTVRDTTMQPDFNVAPGRSDFTDVIDWLNKKVTTAYSKSQQEATQGHTNEELIPRVTNVLESQSKGLGSIVGGLVKVIRSDEMQPEVASSSHALGSEIIPNKIPIDALSGNPDKFRHIYTSKSFVDKIKSNIEGKQFPVIITLPFSSGESISSGQFRNYNFTDAKFFSDLLTSKSFISKGFDGLNADTRGFVFSRMISASHDSEILKSIVKLIPIDVVNSLTREKLTPDMLFHDPSMFVDLSNTINRDSSVSVRTNTARAFASAIAQFATEKNFASSDSGRVSFEFNSTERAIKNSYEISQISNQSDIVPRKNGVVQGYVYNNKVYLVADNIPKNWTDRQILGLLTHEISNHAMEMGKDSEGYQNILKQADVMRRMGNVKIREAYDRAVNAGTPEEHLQAEQLGYFLEANPTHSLTQKFIAWFRAQLRSLGDAFKGAQKMAIVHWANKLNEGDIIKMAHDALVKSGETVPETRNEFAMASRAELGLTGKFNLSDYRKSVTDWAQMKWGDQTAPDGSKVWQNFSQWFGDSKVVDENGVPMVVYHGTSEGGLQGDQFMLDKLGSVTKSRSAKAGFFFVENKSVADGYSRLANEKPVADLIAQSEMAERAGKWDLANELMAKAEKLEQTQSPKEHVIEAFLALKNPHIIDVDGERFLDVEDQIHDAIREAKKSGNDGIIIHNLVDNADWGSNVGTTHIIAFKPEQIKSAIGNTGAFNPKDANILYSKAKGEGLPLFSKAKEVERTELPAETWLQSILRTWQDKTNRFEVIQNYLKDNGVQLSEMADVHRAMNLSVSKISAEKRIFREQFVEPWTHAVAEKGFDIDQIAEYLQAQHTAEANAQIQKIHNDPKALAFGITNEQAQTKLAEFKSMPNFNEFKRLADKLQSITSKSTDMLVFSGAMSQEQADAYRAAYKYYVPMKGEEDLPGTSAGSQKLRTGQKRRLGHELRNEEIVSNILKQHENAITFVQINNVRQSMASFLLEANDPAIGTVGKPQKRQVLTNQKTFVVQYDSDTLAAFKDKAQAQEFILHDVTQQQLGQKRFVTGYKIEQTSDPLVSLMASPVLGENEVNVYVAGHEVRMQFNDELLARAATNLSAEQMGSLLGGAKAINNFLSQVYTGKNPEFFFKNVARDAIGGTVNLVGDYGFKTTGDIWANYPGVMKQLWLARNDMTKSSRVMDYANNGGLIGASYMSSLDRIGDNYNRSFHEYIGAKKTYELVLRQELDKGATKAQAKRRALFKAGVAKLDTLPVIGHLLTLMEHLNSVGESALRMATYETLVKAGRSKEEAAYAAKNSTLNFDNKGEMTTTAGALYLFFNPAVQGVTRSLGAISNSPNKHQAQVLVGMMTMAAFTLAEMGRSGGDDDDRKWREIQKGLKDRNLILRMGDTLIKVPVPYEFGWFVTLGNEISNMAHGGSAASAGLHLAMSAMQNMLPVGDPLGDTGEAQPEQILPTLVKMGLAPTVNRNNFGNPIVPEKWNESTPDSQNMWRNTKGSWESKLASGINSATGGSQFHSGFVDISPETIRYWISSIGGGTARFSTDTVNMAYEGIQGVVPEKRDVPITRSFIQDMGVADSRRMFWDVAKKAKIASEEFHAAIKAGKPNEARSLMQENKALIALAKSVEMLQKVAKAKRDAIEKINLDDKMSLSQKRVQIKFLENGERNLYERFTSNFDKQISANKH